MEVLVGVTGTDRKVVSEFGHSERCQFGTVDLQKQLPFPTQKALLQLTMVEVEVTLLAVVECAGSLVHAV